MSGGEATGDAIGARLAGAVGEPHVAELASGWAARPGSANEAADVVREARRAGVKVVLGSAAEGGQAGAVSIDLGRMAEVLHLDETSLLVHAQAGITLRGLEERLVKRAMTLGPLPPASRGRTVGAALAAPRPSEATPRGRLVDACGAIDAVLGDGTLVHTRLAPRRATGPDLSQALIGGEGRTGIIVGAWLRCARRAPERRFAGWALPSGSAAAGVARALIGRGARPSEIAVVDGGLAAEAIGAAGIAAGEALLALRLDGVEELVRAEEELAAGLAGAAGARTVAAALAAAWFEKRPVRWGGERFVASTGLEAAWEARGARAELCGFTAAGAALVDDRAAEAGENRLGRYFVELERLLDPGGVFRSHA